MIIASYNIMSGGFDSYAPISDTPQRLSILQTAIKKLNADVVGLIDTFKWDEMYTEAELKKLFGYTYAYCINLNDERLKRLGHNNGITLLSNVKVINPRTIRLATRDAILAGIEDDRTRFNLANVSVCHYLTIPELCLPLC